MLTTRYHLDEAHLSYYDEKLKSWASSQPVKTLPSSLYPWTQTDKAGAVTCWPVGETPLETSVDFLFTETPPSNGQPKAPDNPSTITGVSSVKVTRCNKNIIPFPYKHSSREADGIVWTVNADGSVTANGKATQSTNFILWAGGEMKIPVDVTYTLSGCPSTGGWGKYYIQAGDGYFDIGSGGRTFSFSSGQTQYMLIVIKNDVTVDNVVFKPQLELGSSSTQFELYSGADYSISLGNTYYGGTLDVASGVMTVTHSGMALNGDTYLSTGIFDELADVYGVGFYPNPERLMTLSDSSDAACSILPIAIGTGAKNYPCAYLANNAMGIRLQFSKASLGLGDGVDAGTVRTAVHALLAQYPGFIVWPVAMPTTVQLTPTQILSLAQADKYTPRINTVYTDASAVQVGYVKSPIRTEFELQQAIVGQGGEI